MLTLQPLTDTHRCGGSHALLPRAVSEPPLLQQLLQQLRAVIVALPLPRLRCCPAGSRRLAAVARRKGGSSSTGRSSPGWPAPRPRRCRCNAATLVLTAAICCIWCRAALIPACIRVVWRCSQVDTQDSTQASEQARGAPHLDTRPTRASPAALPPPAPLVVGLLSRLLSSSPSSSPPGTGVVWERSQRWMHKSASTHASEQARRVHHHPNTRAIGGYLAAGLQTPTRAPAAR